MNKTLIGKNSYLFLQNDSCKELEVHNNNLCLVKNDFYKRYEQHKHIYLLIVFPNKSLVQKDFLPDGYKMIYRPAFNIYSGYFKNNIIDAYALLKDIDDTFYKTDTHINFKGTYIVYKNFVNKINELFGLNIDIIDINIEKKSAILSNLNMGIGDLTWKHNLGDQVLNDIMDTYYYTNDIDSVYMKHIVINNDKIRLLEQNLHDITNQHINSMIDWNILSKYILYKNNENKNHTVLIFYDSFLTSTTPLYLNMFKNVYMSKSVYDNNLINIIKPDYIFEFRCERFLF
jgi:hypothetical protein